MVRVGEPLERATVINNGILVRSKLKSRLIFSGILAVAALVVNWLLLGQSSPFHNHFLWHGELPDLWMALNIIPVFGSAIAAGNPHSGSEIIYGIILVTQWFIVGFLLSGPLLALKFWKS